MLKQKIDIEMIRRVTLSHISQIRDRVTPMLGVVNVNENLHGDFVNIIKNGLEDDSYLTNSANKYLRNGSYTEYVSVMAIKVVNDKVLSNISTPLTSAIYLNDLQVNIDSFLSGLIEKIDSEIEWNDTYNILGMRTEYCISQIPNIEDYTGGFYEYEKNYITLQNINTERYYEIESYTFKSPCYSGYAIADYGVCVLKPVKKVNIMARIKTPTSITLPKEINDSVISKIKDDDYVSLIENVDEFTIDGIITASSNGGDVYYPSGYVTITKDMFNEPSIRQMPVRPVWLFKGASGLGKTFLSDMICSNLTGKTKFETDSVSELPEYIIADIIVLGNKNKFSIEEIEERIPLSYKLIVVDFTC